jgi:hypothetical protein
MRQPIQQNYSHWPAPSFGLRVKPLWHEPQLACVLDGIDYMVLRPDEHPSFENVFVFRHGGAPPSAHG